MRFTRTRHLTAFCVRHRITEATNTMIHVLCGPAWIVRTGASGSASGRFGRARAAPTPGGDAPARAGLTQAAQRVRAVM